MTTSDVPLGFPAVRARTVLGASSTTPMSGFRGRQRTGLEARASLARMSLQSDYIRLTDERRGQSVTDEDLSPLVAQGWYVSATYGLTRKGATASVASRPPCATKRLTSGSPSDETPSTGRSRGRGARQQRPCHDVGPQLAVNKWVEGAGQSHRDNIGLPSMGPMPERALLEPRIPLQLTL